MDSNNLHMILVFFKDEHFILSSQNTAFNVHKALSESIILIQTV